MNDGEIVLLYVGVFGMDRYSSGDMGFVFRMLEVGANVFESRRLVRDGNPILWRFLDCW